MREGSFLLICGQTTWKPLKVKYRQKIGNFLIGITSAFRECSRVSFVKNSCCALSDQLYIGYYVTFRDTVAELARYPPFKGISTLMSKVPPKLHRI